MAENPVWKVYSITKLEAAKRQIETAVTLWFNEGDAVSTHTLISAAHRVVHDVAESKGLPGAFLVDSKRLEEWGYDAKTYKKAIRSAETFFKHAANDPEGTHEFSDIITATIFASTIDCYKRLKGNMTPLMRFFRFWFDLANTPLDSVGLSEQVGAPTVHLIKVAQTVPRFTFFDLFSNIFLKPPDV